MGINVFEEELNKLKENEDHIEYLRDIFLNDINNIKQYNDRINKLVKFSKENNLYRSEAWGYCYLGWFNFDISEFETAINNFFISYEKFENLNNKYEIAYACNGLTNAYCRIGQFKLANEWGIKGITFCEETGNNKAMIILLINSCINYIQMEYYDKAKEILDNIQELNIELTPMQEISSMLSAAEIEINVGSPKKALKIIDEAFMIESENHLNIDISEMFKLRGMAYVKTGEYTEAEKQFEKSYNFCLDHNLIYEKYSTMLKWSKLCLLIGNYEKAICFLNQIIDIGPSNKFNIIIREAFYLLHTAYKEQNITDKALDYLEKYIKIDDEMYDYEQNQLMVKMNLENAKLEAKQYKILYKRTELLSTVGQKIISNLNITLIIRIINDEINKLFDADYFGIAIYDRENNQLKYYMIKDNILHEKITKYDFDNYLGAYCIENKEDIIIGNKNREYKKYLNLQPKEFEGFADEGIKVSSIIYTPMIINEKVVGLMAVLSKKENLYCKDELNILKILANYTAIAVENALSYKKIEDIATYDNLTKFLTKLEILKIGNIVYGKYKNKEVPFSVIMMDVDNFKKVNDTYGHVNGDAALRFIAKTISKCIRSTDYIGRFGGDEFLLICPGAGIKEALEVAERIRTTIENISFTLSESKVNVTLCLGVHQCTINDVSFVDAVNKADECLYYAKKAGKNTVKHHGDV